MSKRIIVMALVVLLTLPLQRAVAATPVEVDVILSLTGAGAFLGTTSAQTLRALEAVVNKQGGIAGAPLAFNISDDQSNPTITVQLANVLIAKHVPVILGSSISAVCRAVAPLLERTGPLNYCFSPGMAGVADGYVFSAGPSSANVEVTEARFFRERGQTQIAMLSSTDSSGQQDHDWFVETLRAPENKDLRLIADERFNPTDVSVAAQIAHIKAVHPQALLIRATGSAFGSVLRAVSDAGLDIPMTASGSNLNFTQLAQYVSFAPKELLFSTTRGIVPDPSLPPGALKDAQTIYFSALAAAGVTPSANAVLAWDPAWILVGALRRLGPAATAEQLHAYLEGLNGWAGVSGIYDFRGGNQRGLGADALQVYRWEPSANRVVIASKPGGRLR